MKEGARGMTMFSCWASVTSCIQNPTYSLNTCLPFSPVQNRYHLHAHAQERLRTPREMWSARRVSTMFRCGTQAAVTTPAYTSSTSPCLQLPASPEVLLLLNLCIAVSRPTSLDASQDLLRTTALRSITSTVRRHAHGCGWGEGVWFGKMQSDTITLGM